MQDKNGAGPASLLRQLTSARARELDSARVAISENRLTGHVTPVSLSYCFCSSFSKVARPPVAAFTRVTRGDKDSKIVVLAACKPPSTTFCQLHDGFCNDLSARQEPKPCTLTLLVRGT